MRFVVGAVDRGALRADTSIHQRVEQPEPEATARPAVELVVYRRRLSVLGRAIAPATANLQHMHDPDGLLPVVLPASSWADAAQSPTTLHPTIRKVPCLTPTDPRASELARLSSLMRMIQVVLTLVISCRTISVQCESSAPHYSMTSLGGM